MKKNSPAKRRLRCCACRKPKGAAVRRRQKQKKVLVQSKISADGCSDIIYETPPSNRAERRRRQSEQRALAKRRGKTWNELCKDGKKRRYRFGSKAVCQNVHDVRDLARINGRIAHNRELKAVESWRLLPGEMERLERCIGFAASDRIIASNKLVRTKTCTRIARKMGQLYSRSSYHFYWITLIHDGWHTSHKHTVLDLADIRSRVAEVMRRAGLDWLGMIELDIFNNWNFAGGLRITPHVHLIAWRRVKKSSSRLLTRMDESVLQSSLGAPTIKIRPIRTASRLAHLCYYMAKPNYLVKSLGQINAQTGRRKVYSVEASARPSHTLRIAEILSYLEIGELMLAHGRGERIKASLLRSLASSSAIWGEARHLTGDISEMWEALMPPSRRDHSTVEICR